MFLLYKKCLVHFYLLNCSFINYLTLRVFYLQKLCRLNKAQLSSIFYVCVENAGIPASKNHTSTPAELQM